MFCTRSTFTSSTSGGLSFVKIKWIRDVIRPIKVCINGIESHWEDVCKTEIIVPEWRKRLFFALLTPLGCQWSDLQGEPQQHNLPSIFYQNEDGNFCLCCCCHSLLLFHCCLHWCQSIVCVACPASVAHVTHGAMSRGCIFIVFFCKFFIACFVVVLDVLVAGDLRHKYSQSTWGFPLSGPSGYWLRLSCLHHGNWHPVDDDCCREMSIVVILTTSSWCLCCICWQGCLVASEVDCHCPSCQVRGTLVLWALWHFTMMASIASIAISNGFDCAHCYWWWHCCLLLLVVTVPSSDDYIVFTARIINSFITIQTEFSIY